MSELVLFILVCYGATNIIVYGSLFEKLRNFFVKINPSFIGKLFTCSVCMGFWVGVCVAYLLMFVGNADMVPMYKLGPNGIPLILFFAGCISSGTSSMLDALNDFFSK